jgi:CHASE3 domain sensor protein
MGFHAKNVSMIQSKLATFVRLTPRSARRQRARTEAAKTTRTSRSLPKRFWQNLALIAVPAAVLGGIETYHATTILPDLARSRAAVAHRLQVIDAARTLDEAIQDAQRGERGFIITGNLEYLEPYTNSIKDAPARLTELNRHSPDSAWLWGQGSHLRPARATANRALRAQQESNQSVDCAEALKRAALPASRRTFAVVACRI